MKVAQNSIDLTPTHRVVALTMIIAQYALFAWSNLLMTHYHTVKMPFLDYESMIDSPSGQTHYLRNTFLYILFWLQHILMATLKYKMTWLTTWKYFPLYDRYIYNIASGLALWFVFGSLKPSNHYLFTLPMFMTVPLSIIGVIMLIIAMRQLGGRILMPFKLRDLLNDKQITYFPYDAKNVEGLKMTGIYSYTRNPMQAGVLLLILFGNPVYTIDRVIMCLVMGVGVIVGVMMEQKRMTIQFKEYTEYMKTIRWRFIPYII